MKFIPLPLILGFLVGCASDDARLHGTWRSNREATVAAAFQNDPRWTNAPPEKVARFSDIFGRMTITYSAGMATYDFSGEAGSFHYRVVRRGNDFVVIQSDAPMDKGRDIRLRFVNGNSAYWIHSAFAPPGLDERFDKIQDR